MPIVNNTEVAIVDIKIFNEDNFNIDIQFPTAFPDGTEVLMQARDVNNALVLSQSSTLNTIQWNLDRTKIMLRGLCDVAKEGKFTYDIKFKYPAPNTRYETRVTGKLEVLKNSTTYQ